MTYHLRYCSLRLTLFNDTKTWTTPTGKKPARMSSPSGTSVLPQYGPQYVHPFFHPSKFPSNIDYQRAFYDAAVLATRLMDSPQAIQHDYCFYFGKSERAMKPLKNRAHGVGHPDQYACNKGIGELDAGDIAAVQEQRLLVASNVHFEVTDLRDIMIARCVPGTAKTGPGGRISTIQINSAVYQACLDTSDPEYAALIKFRTATTMLHELAHAAHRYLFGLKVEDFRENSNVREGGFEYESRLFGTVVTFNGDRGIWHIWQSHERLEGLYDLDYHSRRTWQIPKSAEPVDIDSEFIFKLFDDRFWQGEYVQRGALALIPEHVANLCRSRSGCITYKSIPLSIRDLFREGGASYAQKKYARLANPGRVLRTAAPE